MRIVGAARDLASNCVRPLARRAARAFIAGDTLSEADQLVTRLCGRGLGVTLGYWDGPGDFPRGVADEYLACIGALEGYEHGYVSIKVPSLGYSRELMDEIVERAARGRIRVHFDALGPDTAEQTQALFGEFLDRGADLSYTLPGRWQRSVADADWAVQRGITVRVVKGQWSDPADPSIDPRAGFLRVIDALAGRARHVAVASHDLPLVAQAVERLRAASTSCQLELLYGLPMREVLRFADAERLAVHVYVPYGKAYLPYALSKAKADPKILWWMVRDFLASCRPRTRRLRMVRELVVR